MSRVDRLAGEPTEPDADEVIVLPPDGAVRRRRARWRWLLIPALAAAFAGAGVGATHTGVFSARHIEVTGTAHLSAQLVIKESGVTAETNVFYLDPFAIESRLALDPWIARATVTTSLPSTIRIDVVEREPVAQVYRGGMYFLVSGAGTMLGTRGADPHLPTLLPSGPGPASSPVTSAATALAAMPPDLRHQVTTVTTDDTGQLTLTLRRGAVVRYGPATDTAAKAASLGVLLSWATSHHTRFVSLDVTSPNAPAAVLPGGASVQP